MECEVIQVPQGSDEWDALRRCRITASVLSDVMAGEHTKRYKQVMSRIILEIGGAIIPNDEGPWFEHGKRMEPRAIGAYEWRYGQNVQHDLFLVSHQYHWLGCSPDGMTDHYTEGVEFKCRSVWNQYQSVVKGAIKAEAANQPGKIVPPAHRFQIQGAMWVTGLDSWWYCNYFEHPKDHTRKLHRILVPRDDQLIKKMETRCVAFMKEVYEITGTT